MSVTDWLADFTQTIDVSGLRNAAAASFVDYMQRYATHVGAIVECRCDNERELIILDLRTGAPQRPFYPIHPIERIGVLFVERDVQPIVLVLRYDFPDTEHQLLVPEGVPAAICIDDRPWAEARLTWTPAELIERVLLWFRRAARGELHDAHQPVDPVMIGSNLSVYVAQSVLNKADQDLIALFSEKDGQILRVEPLRPGFIPKNSEPFTIITYRVAPAHMKRLKHAPATLAQLATMLEERGIILVEDLRNRLRPWVEQGEAAACRLNGRFAIIVEMPVISPRGVLHEGVDHRAFVTKKAAGEIAVALGIAQPSHGHGKVGYVPTIGATKINDAAIAEMEVQCAEVNLAFEPQLATRLAGRRSPDARAAVLVGAGAIGSHIADYLTREGRFLWTIIDDDRLLPHNLARHVATTAQVMAPKAEVLAAHLNNIMYGANCASALVANLLAGGEVDKVLSASDIIIDATASVAAARYLSDHGAKARRVSAFFNPTGEAAVVLAEPKDRSLTLRDLEAQYFGLLLHTDHLRDHLARKPETIAYTGACRAITNRIPESRAAVLSGLAASKLSAALDSDDGVICIWSLASDGSVIVDAVTPQPVSSFSARDWKITIEDCLLRHIHAMRDEKLPAETGGVLFGLVDIPAQHIHLVHAAPAPPDSREERTQFIRGVQGVTELMDEVRLRTAGQVRYVGEWHSHPPRTSARPSAMDGAQIDWLAALMGIDSIPALMLIAGESETAVILANQKAVRVPPTA